uniref:Ribosome-recycling factor, mitochondrial n=1 Tax=Panagrellus redivivus TaxID=6233 RepID=A0A7E5A0M5_PANRE
MSSPSLICRRLFPICRQITSNGRYVIPTATQIDCRSFSLSSVDFKVRKGDKKKNNATSNLVHASHAHNAIVDVAMKEMENLEKVLEDELVKHFSTKVDLRVYEDISVVLDSGEEHKMNRLGRVSLKSPQMVMINFSDNPSAIKAAKIALQKSSLAVNPQHEGIVLYVPVPRMTRERREELAHAAKTTILNDYREALNKVYIKHDKKSTKDAKNLDEAVNTRNLLLAAKRALEQRGAEKIEQQRKALMKEVA